MKYKTRFFLFFLAMTVFYLAANFAHPVTPTIIKNLQLNDYMFGVALAMMQLANFLLSPFWGKINGYISSKVSLLIGCCGYGVAQIWFAYATTEFSIICARLLAGAFVGAIFVSFLTYVVNISDAKDQARYLTYSATISSVAGAFGYLIGGFLGEISIKGTFLIQSITLIASGIFFYFICSSRIFNQFIVGKAIDSLIIGIICLVGCMVMKLPYYGLIAFVVGVTNMIPFFGPFIGAIPCMFLLLLVDPMKMLMFTLFIFFLQQLDGNVIGPAILGDALGLPSLLIMFAVIIGGGLFGVLGMFIGVPVFALIYTLFKEFVGKSLDKKKIVIE